MVDGDLRKGIKERLKEYRKTHPAKPWVAVGTARELERGIDLDTMKRFVTFELDPPLDGRRFITRNFYSTDIDGMPMPLKNEERMIRLIAHSMGYELAEDGDGQKEEG